MSRARAKGAKQTQAEILAGSFSQGFAALAKSLEGRSHESTPTASLQMDRLEHVLEKQNESLTNAIQASQQQVSSSMDRLTASLSAFLEHQMSQNRQ